MTTPALPRLLSAQELADHCGVSLRSVYQWNYEGSGPTPIRVGKYIRYSVEDVARWLEANKASGPERRVGCPARPGPPGRLRAVR